MCCLICKCCSLLFLTILAWCALGLLIFVAIVFPSHKSVEFNIVDASLTEFNITNTDIATGISTLHYNLALNISITNPNKNVGINYSVAQVVAKYRDARFAAVGLLSTPFYQDEKNTTNVHFVAEGQQLVVLDEHGLSMFNSDVASGVLGIDLILDLRMSIRYGKIRTTGYAKPQLDIDQCKLKIPLTSFNGKSTEDQSPSPSPSSSSNGTSAGGLDFKSTKCWKAQLFFFTGNW